MSRLRRYRATVAYDGTAYAGWQIQPKDRTIQGEMERILKRLTGEERRISCSGRTDAGVHARGQVVHFDLESPQELWELQRGFNGLLDDDVRIMTLARAPSTFHARFSAKGKDYRYFIWDGLVLPPAIRLYRCHARSGLDLEAMREAASHLVGRHDFASFTVNPNREMGDTVRTIHSIDLRRKGHDITIVCKGEGFLYRMVRSLAGVLIRVGSGRMKPDTVRQILGSTTRTERVPTAPAKGLFLWKVTY